MAAKIYTIQDRTYRRHRKQGRTALGLRIWKGRLYQEDVEKVKLFCAQNPWANENEIMRDAVHKGLYVPTELLKQ